MVFDSGRVSTMRTVSPIPAWLRLVVRVELHRAADDLLVRGCSLITSTLTTIVLSALSETTTPRRSWRAARLAVRLLRCARSACGSSASRASARCASAARSAERACATSLLRGTRASARLAGLRGSRLGTASASAAASSAAGSGCGSRHGSSARGLGRQAPRHGSSTAASSAAGSSATGSSSRRSPRPRPRRLFLDLLFVRHLALDLLLMEFRWCCTVRMRAISRLASFRRAVFSSAPVAAWNRRLNSSCRVSASRCSSSSSVRSRIVLSPQRDHRPPRASRTSS